MSAIPLPLRPPNAAETGGAYLLDARRWFDLQRGKYAGCRAHRTVDGRTEVGTLLGLTRMGETDEVWAVMVSRRGVVFWWPLESRVYLNI